MILAYRILYLALSVGLVLLFLNILAYTRDVNTKYRRANTKLDKIIVKLDGNFMWYATIFLAALILVGIGIGARYVP